MTSYSHDLFLKNLSELIAIPSVKSKPEKHAPFGIHTAEALQYMLDLASSMGLQTINLDNKAGYIEWGDGKKMIAVLAHLDVVPAGDNWDMPPFELTDKDNYLWGRGIVDNKGPALCALYALLRLRESGYKPDCRIRIILGIDEETNCSCMEHYVASERLPDAGFTPDADFPAIFAEKGILHIELFGTSSQTCTARGGDAPNVVPAKCELYHYESKAHFDANGLSAHASTPQKGENAILKLVRSLPDHVINQESMLSFICDKLMGLPDMQNLISCIDDDESGTLTINPAQLDINHNKSKLTLDIRYPVHSDFATLYDELKRQCALYGLSINIFNHLPPLFLDKNSKQIRTLLPVYEKYLDKFYCENRESTEYKNALLRPVQAIAIGGGTYARSIENIVAFGPSTPWIQKTMHQKNECFPKSDMFLLIDLYKDALHALSEQYKS